MATAEWLPYRYNVPAQLLKSAYWSKNKADIVHYTGEVKPWSWHLNEKSVWKSSPRDDVLLLWHEFMNPSFERCKAFRPKQLHGVTCVITTFSRPVTFAQAVIDTLEDIDDIVAIRVKNLNPRRSIERSNFVSLKKLAVDHYSDDTLNNRFDVTGIDTEGVLYLDDDIVAAPVDIKFMLKAWQTHKKKLTGFFSRTHDSNLYSFNTRESYSMLLTKALVVHIDYVYKYDCLLLPELKQYVTDHMNCEDILMNFIVASVSSESPALVAARPVIDYGRETGLSVKAGKADKGFKYARTKCIAFFTHKFGHNPLRFSVGAEMRGFMPKTIIETGTM